MLKFEKCTNWEAWDHYISNHSLGTLYHLSAWKIAIELSFNLKDNYSVVLQNDKIVGVLPFFSLNTLFSSKKMISIPYAVYGGILCDNEDIEKKALDFIIKQSMQNDIRHIEFRCLHNPEYNLPRQDLYVTYKKELEQDEEKILLSIPRKSRASIRNGYKKFNLKSEVNTDIDQLYKLYLQNKRKLGSPPYPKSFFYNLIEKFNGTAKIMSIYYDNHAIASVLFFEYKNTLYPYFSGADPKYYYTNANNILYYELMVYGLKNNFRWFDFGRSRIDTGAGHFKKNMGFQSQPLNYYHYLPDNIDIPEINPSNKKFDLISKTWSKLPLFVTQMIGPQIVKRIP